METVKIINKLVALIKSVKEDTIERWTQEQLDTEPDITSSFVTIIETLFNNFSDNSRILIRGQNVFLRGRVFRGIGRNAPEKEFGADFSIIFTLQINDDFIIKKGVFIQAKMERNPLNLRKSGNDILLKVENNSEFNGENKLKNQIERMLDFTSQSFVLIYTKFGFFIANATEILNQAGKNEIIAIPIEKFFKLLFKCFIGDYKLIRHQDEFLKELRRAKADKISGIEKYKFFNANYTIWFDIIQK